MEFSSKPSEIFTKMTPEQKRLLYLIGLYTEINGQVGKQWMKDLSLKAVLIKGVREKVFDWDYAPASVMYMGTRKIINVTQEGQNDLNHLRIFGLISRLRLGTIRHFFFNAYGLTPIGINVFRLIQKEDREPIDILAHCSKCGKLFEITSEQKSVYMICSACNQKVDTEVSDIESVQYMCVPKWLKVKLESQWKPVLRKGGD
jgi:WD repeat-containing protein 35